MIKTIICLDTISIDNLKSFNNKYDSNTVIWIYPESNRSPNQILDLFKYIESDSNHDHVIYTSNLLLIKLLEKKDVKWFCSEEQVIYEFNDLKNPFEWFISKYQDSK